jgi:hypothetical protein
MFGIGALQSISGRSTRGAKEDEMGARIPEELAGRSIDCVFTGFTPRLTFREDGLRLQAALPDMQIDEVVEVDVTTVRPRVFALNWTERSGNFIVQVQDHENSVVYNYARLSNGELFCQTGTLRPVSPS